MVRAGPGLDEYRFRDAVVKEVGATQLVIELGDEFVEWIPNKNLMGRDIMFHDGHRLFGGTIKKIEKVDEMIHITVKSGQYVEGDLGESNKERQQFPQFDDDLQIEDKIEVFLLPKARKPVANALVMEVSPSSIDPDLKGKRGASDNNVQIADWDANGNGILDDMEGYRLEALLVANIEKWQGLMQQLDQLKDFKVYEVKYVPARAGLFTKSHYFTGLGKAIIWQPDQTLSKYYIDINIVEAKGQKGGYICYDNLRRLFDVDKKSDEIINRVRANLRSRKLIQQRQTEEDPEKEFPDYRLSATIYDRRSTPAAFQKVEVSKILTIRQGPDKIVVRLVVMGGPGIEFLGSPIKLPIIELLLEEESEFQN